MEARLSGVTFQRGRRRVLDVPALSIAPGRVTAILGPNGSGKSSLLRLVAGIERPTTGEVRIDGVDSTVGRRYRPLVALAFQRPVFLAGTVRYNLELALRLRQVPATDRGARITEIATACGIASILDRDARRLSGGEAQRSNLARALVLRAPVTLLDEPFSGLDAPSRLRLMTELPRLLQAFAATVLLVTHDRDEARLLADDLVVLLDGRVAADGPVEEVFRRPRTPAVARFLGRLVLAIPHGLIAADPAAITPGEGLLCFDLDVVRVLPGEDSRVVGFIDDQPVTVHWPTSPLPVEGSRVPVHLPAEASELLLEVDPFAVS